MMRIIAGKWRGRTIHAPDTMETRPILDRAKVVLFDMLGHRLALPGQLPPIAVLDLFAGSGALGIEAVSRGARYCLSVEQSRPIAAVIRQNLDSLKVVNEIEVVQADASRVTFKSPPLFPDSSEESRHYGLVFVDPPYRMLMGTIPGPHIRELLARLAYEPVIDKNALIVIRHETQAHSPDLSPLVEYERRDVGTMTLRFLVRPGSDL